MFHSLVCSFIISTFSIDREEFFRCLSIHVVSTSIDKFTFFLSLHSGWCFVKRNPALCIFLRNSTCAAVLFPTPITSFFATTISNLNRSFYVAVGFDYDYNFSPAFCIFPWYSTCAAVLFKTPITRPNEFFRDYDRDFYLDSFRDFCHDFYLFFGHDCHFCLCAVESSLLLSRLSSLLRRRSTAASTLPTNRGFEYDFSCNSSNLSRTLMKPICSLPPK